MPLDGPGEPQDRLLRASRHCSTAPGQPKAYGVQQTLVQPAINRIAGRAIKSSRSRFLSACGSLLSAGCLQAVTVIGVKQAQYNAFLLLDFGWTTKFDPDNGVETELTAFSLARGAFLPIS